MPSAAARCTSRSRGSSSGGIGDWRPGATARPPTPSPPSQLRRSADDGGAAGGEDGGGDGASLLPPLGPPPRAPPRPRLPSAGGAPAGPMIAPATRGLPALPHPSAPSPIATMAASAPRGRVRRDRPHPPAPSPAAAGRRRLPDGDLPLSDRDGRGGKLAPEGNQGARALGLPRRNNAPVRCRPQPLRARSRGPRRGTVGVRDDGPDHPPPADTSWAGTRPRGERRRGPSGTQKSADNRLRGPRRSLHGSVAGAPGLGKGHGSRAATPGFAVRRPKAAQPLERPDGAEAPGPPPPARTLAFRTYTLAGRAGMSSPPRGHAMTRSGWPGCGGAVTARRGSPAPPPPATGGRGERGRGRRRASDGRPGRGAAGRRRGRPRPSGGRPSP